MLLVRFLPRHFESDDGDDRRGGIGEIVEGIGDEGDTACEKAQKSLHRKEDEVQKDAQYSGYSSYSLSFLRHLKISSIHHFIYHFIDHDDFLTLLSD